MANQDDDEKSTFAIKGFRVQTRKLAISCARRAGLSMGEWMDRAVHSQARLDAGENIFPPEKFVPPPEGAPAELRPIGPSFAELRDVMQAAQAAAVASGLPMSKRLARSVTALADDQVRLVRGLAPRIKRPKPVSAGWVKPGQTFPKIGQTDSEEVA